MNDRDALRLFDSMTSSMVAIVVRRFASSGVVACVLASFCLTCMYGCKRSGENSSAEQPSGSVVLYVSADDYVARQVVADFEAQTGIDVEMLGDTEAKKTTGLVERLRAEADNPKADVFWSSEVFMTVQLADEGVLAPFESEALADWPEQYRDDERRWYGFASRARVIVYAPGRLQADEVPSTWMELVQPKWAGRIAMADPRFGTTGGHLGAMRAYWRGISPAFYDAFVEGLADNDVALLTSGNAGVVQAVASGEYDLGMTDTDDVWAAQANGVEVDLVYPDHDVDARRPGSGTLLIPNTVARVAGGPNPDAAAVLIEYLLSPRAERILAESDSHNVPMNPALAEEFSEYAVPNPLRVSYEDAAAHRQAAINALLTAINNRAERSAQPPVEREPFRPRSYTDPDEDDKANDDSAGASQDKPGGDAGADAA